MASIEGIGLPLGNEWEFSAMNYHLELQPGRGREITQPSNELQELVKHVESRFICKGWQFTSIVGAFPKINKGSPELFIIFTSRERVILTDRMTDDINKFIKPEIVSASSSTDRDSYYGRVPRSDDRMNKILKGTGLVVSNVVGRYNLIVGEGERIFRQTGVGHLDISLEMVDKAISEKDQELKKLMLKVRPLQEERAILLALQSPNPVRLFN